jgi:CcmD family protein
MIKLLLSLFLVFAAEHLFFALAGHHPRSLSLAHARSPFDELTATLSNVEGSLGPQALAVANAAQPPSAGQGGFVPIDQLPAPESFPAGPLVIAAYAFAWVAVLAYVFSVWRRLNRVETELRDVMGRLERGGRR